MEDKNKLKKGMSKALKNMIKIFICITLLIIGLLLYSRYIGTKGIEIKEYKIVSEDIDDNFHGLKIVHLSDIHYGRITFEYEIKEMVKKINLTKPDIVVLTGDLIDKDTDLTGEMQDVLSEELSKIDATIGKYAITGNHDINFENWDLIIENSGFINLNDNYETIYKGENDYILLTGVSSSFYDPDSIDTKFDKVTDYLKELKDDELPKYSILLIHEPDMIDNIDIDSYDLILAGHSHAGQVRIPFIGGLIYPEYAKKYNDNYYEINDTKLYISSGIGTSTINFRFLNKPSFNLYRLTSY